MNDREAFEAWLTPRRGKICPPHPEDYWEVWQAALASERAKPNEWKEAIIDKLVVIHILQESREFDPHKALNDLIEWETQIALDPKVSSQAQELIDRGAAYERAKQGGSYLANRLRELANSCSNPHLYEKERTMLEAAEFIEASERAKQAEPVGKIVAAVGGFNDVAMIQWTGTYRPTIGDLIYAAPPAVQAEPTDQLIARLRSLASELDADDSPEQIHPGAALCYQAADALEAFSLQRDLDGPAWERHVERMRLAEDEVQRLKAAPPAKQAKPVACSYCGMRSGHLAACKRPPADDEAVRKDAERYRWLRKYGPNSMAIIAYKSPSACRVEPKDYANYDDYVDAAIDAAIKDRP